MCPMTIWRRLSRDHQAQIRLFDKTKPETTLGVNLVPQMESPFSVSRTLGFVAAGAATTELCFFKNKGEIMNKYWPFPSVCLCQISKINRNPKLA